MVPNRLVHQDPSEAERKSLELARIAYNAYGDSTNWKNVRNEQMPRFEELPHPVVNAWVAAVNRVAQELAPTTEAAVPAPADDSTKAETGADNGEPGAKENKS